MQQEFKKNKKSKKFQPYIKGHYVKMSFQVGKNHRKLPI